MNQYHPTINDYLEDAACQILQSCLTDYVITRNNQASNDIDLKITNHDHQLLCTMDVQYSMNFKKYGDVRIDLMSAGSLVQQSHLSVQALNANIEDSPNSFECFNALFCVHKYGKYFSPSSQNMLGVFYYFYHHSFDKQLASFKQHKADFIFFLPKRVVLHELKTNPKLILKINDKQKHHLHESHHSAFICLNIHDMSKKYQLPLFYDRASFYQDFPAIFQSQLSSLLEMTDEQLAFI